MEFAIVSGGFDPIHKGHVRLIREASRHGRVIVALNTDEWLQRKKGYSFMGWDERAEILRAMDDVYRVIPAHDDDNTVCKTLEVLHCLYHPLTPLSFVNGGDRKDDNVPEVKLCNDLGIKLVWNAGGDKIQSSSELVAKSKANEK